MNGHQTDTKNISIKYLEKILNSYQEREKHTQKYAPKYLKKYISWKKFWWRKTEWFSKNKVIFSTGGQAALIFSVIVVWLITRPLLQTTIAKCLKVIKKLKNLPQDEAGNALKWSLTDRNMLWILFLVN